MNKLAHAIARQALLTPFYDINSIRALSSLYTPAAEGAQNEGFIVPDKSPFLRSEQAQAFISSLLLHDLKGLNRWISLIGLLKKANLKPYYISTYETLLSYVNKLLGPVNLMSWTIPYPQIRDTPNYGPICVTIDATLIDIMGDLNLKHIAEFLNVVIQIAIFGFPLHPKIIKSLDIENSAHNYVISRLLHGKVDTTLQKTFKLSRTAFLPEDSSSSVEMDQALLKLYSVKNHPMQFQMKLNELKSKVHKQHFLGNNSELIQVLIEKNIMKMDDTAYNAYLKKSFPQKLGWKGYQQIMRQGGSLNAGAAAGGVGINVTGKVISP